MLKRLNTYQPAVILILIGYFALLQVIPLFAKPGSFTQSGFLGALLFHGHLNIYLLKAGSFLVIAVSCINQLVRFNALKIFSTQSFLPLAAYALCFASAANIHHLNPVLVAAALVFGTLSRLWKLPHTDLSDRSLFDAGLLIGIASLFYAPALWFTLFLPVGILLMRSFSGREIVVSLLGVITPLFLTATLAYLFDSLDRFWDLQLNISPQSPSLDVFNHPNGHYLFLLLVFLPGLKSYLSSYVRNSIIIRKSYLLLFLLGLISILFTFLFSFDNQSIIVFTLFPLSILLGNYFVLNAHKMWAEIIHIVLILVVLYFQFSGL